MAVSHDATNTGSTAAASINVSLTVSTQRDRYLVVGIYSGHSGAPNDLTGVTYNGVAMTELLDILPTATNRLWLYGLVAPSTGTNNVSVTWAGANLVNNVIASAFYGVDQTSPVGTARSNSVTSGFNVWLGLDGGLAGGMCVGFGSRGTTAVAAGQTITPFNGIPEYIAAGALSAATAQTSRTPAAPTGALRGDLEIAHCSSENNATHSVSGSGWVKIGQTNSGASFTVSHYYRIHDGTNVDPVISWTGSADASARRYLFRDTRAKNTPVAYHGTVGTGTASPHTSTGANTTEDDVLAIYIDICNANTAMAPETSWTERVDSGSATGPIRSYLADREMATAGSATGNISEAGGAAAYVQQQFEIYNADNGDQVQVGEIESYGDFISSNMCYEVADTYNTFGWTTTLGTTDMLAALGVPLNPSKSLPPYTSPMRQHLAM